MRTRHASHLASLLALVLAILACGQSSVQLAPPASSSYANIQKSRTLDTRLSLPHGWLLYHASAAIPYDWLTTPKLGSELAVSASCQPGERMLGAAYGATSVFEFNATIFSSYPVDDHTWTASGGTQAGLEVDVFCLHGDHLPGVTIAAGEAGSGACPSGTTLLSAGFSREPTGRALRPAGYLLCASSGVTAGEVATEHVILDANSHSYSAQRAEVTCAAGQLAFGGGSLDVEAFASGPTEAFGGWAITGGNGTGTLYANCVRFS